jgi:hypothetical protein
MITIRVVVQNIGVLDRAHPYNNNNRMAMGTRLLLRLSKIFHLERREMGFLSIFLPGPGTHGNIQLLICQSPLIHLCLRCMSVT